MQLLALSFLFSILCVTSYRNNMMIKMMNKNIISNKILPFSSSSPPSSLKLSSLSSSSSLLSSKQCKQPWLNKAIIGIFVAFQIFIPTVTLNPSISLADAIPLVGTKAPDFSLPSNAGICY